MEISMKPRGKKRNIKAIVLCLAIAALSTDRLYAENTDSAIDFDISIGPELMSGNTTYRIGYPVTEIGVGDSDGYFPFSELEWPLDAWLARVDVGMNVGSSLRINGTVKASIDKPGDPMIDKDWITSTAPTQLDVYSDSSISDFDALILDFDVEWAFLKSESGSVYAGLGYQYQKFNYDSNVIRQYSPSGQTGFDYTGDGSVSITYEISYSMPYVVIGGKYNISPDFSVAGSFAYSPFVDAQDKDNHILRDKISEGDMDGTAYMIDVSGTYNISPSWFVEGGVHYAKIDVDGTQTQSFSGVPVYLVSQESESSQTSGYLKVGYKF